jgi:hypothetical protein
MARRGVSGIQPGRPAPATSTFRIRHFPDPPMPTLHPTTGNGSQDPRDRLAAKRRASRACPRPPPLVMLIPHDRADLRLGSVRRCTGLGLPAIELAHPRPNVRALGWAWPLRRRERPVGDAFRSCSPPAEFGETLLVTSGHHDDHDLLTRPVLAVCGRALWLRGPWLDYPRTRHQKSPLLERPSSASTYALRASQHVVTAHVDGDDGGGE